MTKRGAKNLLLTAGLVGALTGFSGQRQPNLLVILTDDLGIGHFAFDDLTPVTLADRFQYEQFRITPEKAKQAAQSSMPRTARLAEQSVRMRHAFVASPVCGPSRLALLTSQYPQRFGVYDNFDIKAVSVAADEFLPKKLQQAGYRTAMIGKWHLGRYTQNYKTGSEGYGHSSSTGCHPDEHPMVRGFDSYFGFNPSGTAYWDSPSMYRDHDLVKVPDYLTDVLSDEAVRIVSEESDRPFFLYLAYNAPHTPYDPAPKKYTSRFNTGNADANNFFGMLAAVDDGIGRVVDALEKSGQLDNTLIVFASDNGAVSDSPLPRNGRYKGYKGMFYQGGTQVPMFIRFPISWKNKPVGSVDFPKVGNRGWYEYPVSLLDVMPTCLGAAGLPVPSGVDGVNLLPWLSGDQSGIPHKTLYWAGPFNPQWAVGDASYEYLRNQSFRGPAGGGVCAWPDLMTFCEAGETEFFDLSRDNGIPAPGSSEKAERFKAQFKSWLKKLPEPVKWDRTEWEKLKDPR